MVMKILLIDAGSLTRVFHSHFVYHQIMNVDADVNVSAIAAAIAEPARTRMLLSLLDGRARTSTELAAIADVSPSTASVHLARLKQQQLVTAVAQGKHRYYRLRGAEVSTALEALAVVAGATHKPFAPSTPPRLRFARSCYDHLAGSLAISLHDRLIRMNWLSRTDAEGYEVSRKGVTELRRLGVDVESLRAQRRRFAFACLDWSERRPHIGGAVGAALLQLALTRRWLVSDLDSRALALTKKGQRELSSRFGIPA
jgi:DNA-binding transcriptional ArsR family regulator